MTDIALGSRPWGTIGRGIEYVRALGELLSTSPEVEESPLFDTWIKFPEYVSPRRDDLRTDSLLADIVRWTDWSSRDVAPLIGVSHTTVLQWSKAPPERLRLSNLDSFGRLSRLHRTLKRLNMLANADAKSLSLAVRTLPRAGSQSAYQLLLADQPAEAYLAALDVLRPRPPSEDGLLVGDRPAEPGRAVSSLSDDD